VRYRPYGKEGTTSASLLGGKNMSRTGLTVKLIGRDGNAFAILGTCLEAMRRNKISKEEIEEFKKQAMSGDYNNLLRVVTEWFEVE